jgi:transcriptional regulator with XRE-family HTH domain
MKDGPAHPFAETRAAMMLKRGFDRQKDKGVSLRSVARTLNYAQATVLSHMANGRVAVPIERAAEIARAVGIDESEFLSAAVEQRAPEAARLLGGMPDGDPFNLATEVTMIAGKKLDELSDEQKSIIREVAADLHPGRRWLSIAEVPTVTLVRQCKPDFRNTGLTASEMRRVQAALINGA